MVNVMPRSAPQDRDFSLAENNHNIHLNAVNNIVKNNFTKIQHDISFNKLSYSYAPRLNQPIFPKTIRLLKDSGVMQLLPNRFCLSS